jgi:cell division septation protein DedD
VPNPSYISNASVKFSVEKAWVIANNIDVNTIALYRFKNGIWNKLSASKVSENETLIFYLASTPGFSPFAIAGEKISVAPTLTPTLTPTPGPTELPTTPTPTPTPPTPTPTKPAPGFDMIISATGMMILTYLWKRRLNLIVNENEKV